MTEMFKLMGVAAVFVGFLLARSGRRSEGLGGAAAFLVGLAVLVGGLYLIFVEDGQGAARWLPFLRP